MTCGVIRLFGSEVYVIPTSVMPRLPDGDNLPPSLPDGDNLPPSLPDGDNLPPSLPETTVFALPSLGADLKALLAEDEGNINSGKCLRAAISSAVFLRLGRGLPLDEIDVECPLGNITVFFKDKSNNPCIKAPKCKQLFSNRLEIAQNVEVKTQVYDSDIGKLKLIKCHNTDTFSIDALKQLSGREEDLGLAAVAAYSHTLDGAQLIAYSPLFDIDELILYLASAAERELFAEGYRGRLQITVNASRIFADRLYDLVYLSCADVGCILTSV